MQNDLDDVRLAHVADSEQQTELIVSLADDRVLAKQQRLGSLLGPTEPCLRRGGGLISARGKTHGNHVFDVGVDVRPWEGPTEPCLRRGRGSMSVHGKDQGNRVFDVGGD